MIDHSMDQHKGNERLSFRTKYKIDQGAGILCKCIHSLHIYDTEHTVQVQLFGRIYQDS